MPATFSVPKKVSKRGRVGDGRPTKQTPATVRKVCDAISMGLNDEEAAAVAGISDVSLTLWRRDKAFVEKIKRAVALRLYKRLQKIESGADGWQGTGWVLERLYPTRFAKPEIQLSFNNNYTQNVLSISISGAEAKAIELEAEPIRTSVQEMFQKYRPAAFGNGEERIHDFEATPTSVPIQQPAETAVIEHKDGDEKRASFWRTLVSSDPESFIVKATATFVCREILGEVLGSRSAGMRLEFSEDPVKLGDVLGAIDRASGASGWRAMQKKAGL